MLIRSALFLCSVFFLSACVRSHSTDTNTPAKWIRWAVEKTPFETPCTSPSCTSTWGLIREGLTRLEWQTGTSKVLPNLAQSWEHEQFTKWTIKLRRQLHWSTGAPFLARHFIDTLKARIEQCTNKEPLALFEHIVGAKSYCRNQKASLGLRAIDPQTIEVTLNRADPYFAHKLAHPAYWPELMGSPTASTGPYRIQKEQIPMRLARNPYYHGARSKVEGIILKVTPDPGLRVQQFLQHESDLINPIPPELLESVRAEPSMRWYPSMRATFVVLSPTTSSTQSKSARQLLQASMDPTSLWALLQVPIPTGVPLFPFDFQPPSRQGKSPNLDIRRLLDLKPSDNIQLTSAQPKTFWELEIYKNTRAKWLQELSVELDASTKSKLAVYFFSADLNPSAPLINLRTVYNDHIVPLTHWQSLPFERHLKNAMNASSIPKLETELKLAAQIITSDQSVLASVVAHPMAALVNPSLRQLECDPMGKWLLHRADFVYFN